ncbi:hypothetical protein SLE2022_109160 [Rubroshorea leprosula]
MVLSNKMLKQKSRAELIAKSVDRPDANSNSDTNLQPQSLNALLDSVAQKPILSKKEKGRKTPSLQEEEEEEEEREREEGMEDGAVKEVKLSKKKKGEKKEEQKESEEEGTMEMDTGTDSQANDVVTRVYVGSIPYGSTEEDMRHCFGDCGAIIEVDCVKFLDSWTLGGIAIISFEAEADAKRALALDTGEMGGLQLTIQACKTTRANRVSNFVPQTVEGSGSGKMKRTSYMRGETGHISSTCPKKQAEATKSNVA